MKAKTAIVDCQAMTADVARRLGLLLRQYGTGHPQWYAELLVAAALQGLIQPTNNPKFDVLTPKYGRVEVKNRIDGTDSTQNRSNFGRYCPSDFDYAAIVILTKDYLIKSGILLPCAAALKLVRPHGHVKWADAYGHCEAIDITARLQKVSGEHDSSSD
jgi:hypothetical protein